MFFIKKKKKTSPNTYKSTVFHGSWITSELGDQMYFIIIQAIYKYGIYA
jgi:hypothetical protein